MTNLQAWATNRFIEKATERDEQNRLANTRSVSVRPVDRASDKAIFVQVIGGNSHWIPRSQVAPDSPVKNVGDRGKLIITAWWADKERIG